MKHLFFILFLSCIITSCNKKQDPYLISKQSIGLLTDSTEVKDLATIFINDSIKKNIAGDEFIGNINNIEIYDKTGNLLLILSPSQALDSTATIRTIKVVDSRYKTAKGLSPSSTFKVIKDNYKISSIQNTLKNIIVSVDSENLYFTIDKSDLPAEMRFDMNLKIEAIQIPEQAKIKNYFVQWY